MNKNIERTASILVVDDEKNILSSLERLLRRQGFEIIKASNAQDGLHLLSNTHIDLIITDMRMPGMGGAEFLSLAAKSHPNIVRIVLTGYADLDSAMDAINSGDIYRYVSKPWNDSDLINAIRSGLEKKFLKDERIRLTKLVAKKNQQLKELNTQLEAKVNKSTHELEEANKKLNSHSKMIDESYLNTVKVFSDVIDMRSEHLKGHSRRVAELSVAVSKKLGLSGSDFKDILYAALLHDLAKISLPDSVINKADNRVTPEELKLIQRLPVVTEGLLMPMKALRNAAKLIRSHHEHWDGTGYPDGKKGESIPIGARIISIADDYCSIADAEKARLYILQNSGKIYDPRIVTVFFELNELSAQNAIPPQKASEKKIKSSDLKSGMTLSMDLITPDGTKLLDAGFVLDDHVIDSIFLIEQSFEKNMEIFIHE